MIDVKNFSYFQFVSVILILFLLIFLTVRIVNDRHKLNKYRKIHLFMSSVLLVEVFSSFVLLVVSNVHFFWWIFIILSICFCAAVYLCLKIVFSKKTFIFISFIYSGILGICIWLILLNIKFVFVIPFLCSAVYVWLFNYISNVLLGGKIITDIQKLLLDAVLIVNLKGDLIFSSRAYSESKIFRHKSNVSFEKLEEYFSYPIEQLKYKEIEYIKVFSESPVYIRYSYNEIVDGDKLVGYIITFSDISELMKNLFEFSRQLEEENRINSYLKKSKEEVIKSQREKEITLLLEEVGQNHIRNIIYLMQRLDELNLHDDIEENEIDSLIKESRYILKDVRKVVSRYYDEGEGND